MTKKTNYQKCYSLACYYLAKRDHSIKELTDKLKNKEYPINVIEKVINNLIKLDILNDEKFAFSRIRYRYETCRWGEIRIRKELQEKGITTEIIDSSIKKRKEDGTLIDEKIITQAFDLIYNRYKNKIEIENNRLNSKSYNKVVGFLTRRGYTYSQIKQALELFLNNIN